MTSTFVILDLEDKVTSHMKNNRIDKDEACLIFESVILDKPYKGFMKGVYEMNKENEECGGGDVYKCAVEAKRVLPEDLLSALYSRMFEKPLPQSLKSPN